MRQRGEGARGALDPEQDLAERQRPHAHSPEDSPRREGAAKVQDHWRLPEAAPDQLQHEHAGAAGIGHEIGEEDGRDQGVPQ